MNNTLLATLCLAFTTLSAPAQTAEPSKTPKDWGVELAPEPLRVESVGVTIHVPVGSITQNAVYQKIASTKVILPNDLGAVVLQDRRSTQLELDTEEVADGIITQLLALAPKYGFEKDPDNINETDGDLKVVGTSAAVLERNKAKQIDTYTADLAYVAIPREGTRELTVRGVALIKTGPGRFILIELYTSFSKFQKARENFEVMLATVRISDPSEAASRRANGIATGIRILDRLTESDYRQIFENTADRWERLYTQASSGATSDDEEIGYRRVRASIGQRGEMSPNKTKDQWSDGERQEGYIVRIDARVLDLGSIIDTRATYFLTPDFNEETWVVNMSIRTPPDQFGTPGKTSQWQEIGARRGTEMSVRIVPQSSASTRIRPQIEGEGYISMVQSFMLPQLLAHVGIPGDMAFYTYQTTAGTIRLRTDSLDAAKPGTASKAAWNITTHLNADAEPQITTVSKDGQILRTSFTDGRRWEVIPLDQLVRIWKNKGLPMD